MTIKVKRSTLNHAGEVCPLTTEKPREGQVLQHLSSGAMAITFEE